MTASRVSATHATAVAGAGKAIVGIGRVLLWSGGSLWIGRAAGRAQPHEHHAIQISLALSGCLRLRAGEDADWTPYTAAVVWPHRRHQFDGGGETVAQVFVEPETRQGRALLARRGGPAVEALPVDALEPLVEALRSGYAAGAEDAALVAASQRLVASLCEPVPAEHSVDARISRAIEFIRARLDDPVPLADAAAAAHLSPSRFRHLFVAQTGMSFRAYLLWARVEAAVGAAMGGLSWTEAAQAWGFADSAHLSRTCRRMFGIAPTMLVRESPAGR
jgi:AraC-like DNA-binding protein